MKVALITGVNGQDGSYLSEHLLNLGYKVHGLMRRWSSPITGRLSAVENNKNFYVHECDITDGSGIMSIIKEIKPDEIYNLAAQSFVGHSFENPTYTSNVDGLGVLNVLEGIRLNGLEKRTKFYQASTSELFGKVTESPQNEKTVFRPRSPYAVAKLYAYWLTVNYRESYNMHASNGILFNHESPRRGEEFVSQKICKGAVNCVKNGEIILLGNLDSKRDWGHAKDYVVAMHKILQCEEPQDLVIATGKTYSVRDLCLLAFKNVGIDIEFKGNGLSERAIIKAIGKNVHTVLNKGDTVIEISEKFYRPTEVDLLLGDATKAKKVLNWKATTSFEMLIKEMVDQCKI
jgi:GDPmannose 4,6-dehydratase